MTSKSMATLYDYVLEVWLVFAKPVGKSMTQYIKPT